jgi:disulfide bond formation protein DsbB
MARRTFILLIFAVSIAFISCVTVLSDRGALVRFEENSGMITNCKYMGTVRGTSPAGFIRDLKKENALNEVRNSAALLGANTVVIVSKESMFDETVFHGKAYHCPLNP